VIYWNITGAYSVHWLKLTSSLLLAQNVCVASVRWKLYFYLRRWNRTKSFYFSL